MKSETKILGIILLLTVVLLFGGVFFLSKSGPSKTAEGPVLQIDYSKGEKIGSDSAKVKLVEFSDLQCPACADAEPFVKKIRAAYPDQVQVIYRHFPLPQHTHGREAASFAEAAGEQGKFWEIHDKFFETQADWSNLPETTNFFMNLTNQLGLDETKIKQAVGSDAVKARIDADAAEGRQLGVNSTPTFFLNGRKLNLQNFGDLDITVAEELKK